MEMDTYGVNELISYPRPSRFPLHMVWLELNEIQMQYLDKYYNNVASMRSQLNWNKNNLLLKWDIEVKIRFFSFYYYLGQKYIV